MNSKVVIVILVILSIALGVAILNVQNRAQNQKKQDTATIITYSNSWTDTQAKLDEQKKVNSLLETNLYLKATEVSAYSNMLTSASNSLARTQAEAKAA